MPGPTPSLQFRAPFPIVLLYENADLERQGKDLCDTLRQELDGQAELSVAEWKLEMLTPPALRAVAAGDADAAVMIVMALKDRGAVPSAIKRWMALWSTGLSAEPRLLVLLLETECEADPSFYRGLRAIAQRAKECHLRLIVQSVATLDSQPHSNESKWLFEIAATLQSRLSPRAALRKPAEARIARNGGDAASRVRP